MVLSEMLTSSSCKSEILYSRSSSSFNKRVAFMRSLLFFVAQDEERSAEHVWELRREVLPLGHHLRHDLKVAFQSLSRLGQVAHLERFWRKYGCSLL